jgi:hypothetical protein
MAYPEFSLQQQDPQPRTAEQSSGQNRPVIKTRMKENKNLPRYCSDLRNKTMGERTDSSRNKELKPEAKHKLGRVLGCHWTAQNRNTKTGNEIGKQETEICKQETEICKQKTKICKQETEICKQETEMSRARLRQAEELNSKMSCALWKMDKR